ncbi:PEP-CTERM sorting domain-containing protein [Chthoniobacter flavus]|nr:PEP-CTERM sorting domain-containing protein [Chthoniobacter flavus]
MIQMTGTFTLAGVNNGNAGGDLSFGLYNTNGSSTATGWLGYSASESDGTHTGSFFERSSGNTALYTSTTGETQLATTLATGSPSIADGTYNFTLTLTLQAGNAVNIAYALNRTSTTGYTLSGSFVDTTPLTLAYNRVGFLAGSSLKADQFTISNTNVTFVPIPEPGSAGLLIAGGLGLVVRRRR